MSCKKVGTTSQKLYPKKQCLMHSKLHGPIDFFKIYDAGEEFRFATVHELDLEELEFERGKAFDNVSSGGDSDSLWYT